jgi:hypothetical protein
MKLSIFIITFFSVLSAQGTGKTFDRIITTDADVLLTVRDFSELREVWKEHPLVLDFDDASLGELLKPLFGQAANNAGRSGIKDVMEEFGLDVEELFDLFPGQAGLALYNLPELLLQEADRPDLAILANFSGSAERLDELMQIQFERNAKAQKEINPAIEHELIKEHFMGETLYFDEVFDGEATYIEDGYALVDGIFVLASPAERLRTMVESIKAGSGQPIALSAAYQRVREESGPVDAMLYLNFESFVPGLNEALLTQAMPGAMAMFGVSGRSLNAALTLEALQAFSFDFKVHEAGITSHSALVYREKSGLLALLAYGEGVLPPAEYVPDGALSSTVSLFDLSQMFARLEAFLGAASPSAPALLNIQLEQIKTKSGVDLRSALLENFGAEVVTFSILPEERPGGNVLAPAEQVYVLQIKDAAALSGALEALKDMVPGARAQIETRDFAGETIHTFTNPTNPSMPDAPAYYFSYVVARTHLIFSVGRIGTIQGVLTSMQSNDSGFWQLEETEALVDRVGKPGVVSRSYTDFGQAMEKFLETIHSASQLAGNTGTMDASKIPDLPWHFLTETYEAHDGLFSHMILLRKEGR